MKKRIFVLPLLALLLTSCDLGAIIGEDPTTAYISPTIPPAPSEETSSTATSVAPTTNWTTEERRFFLEHFDNPDILPHYANLAIDNSGVITNYILAIGSGFTPNKSIESYSTLLKDAGYLMVTLDYNSPCYDFIVHSSYRKQIKMISTYENTFSYSEIFVSVGTYKGKFSIMFTKNYYMASERNNFYKYNEDFKNIHDYSIDYMSHFAIDPNEPEAYPSNRKIDFPTISFDKTELNFTFTCLSYIDPYSYGNSLNNYVFESVVFEFQDSDATMFVQIANAFYNGGFNIISEEGNDSYYKINLEKNSYNGTWGVCLYTDLVEGLPAGTTSYEFFFRPDAEVFPAF